MFIHIGNDFVIRSEDIVSIIERNVITSSSSMGEMMDNLEKKAKIYGRKDNAKAVVITSELVYFSTLSVSTLAKRAKMTSTISKLEDYSDEIETD